MQATSDHLVIIQDQPDHSHLNRYDDKDSEQSQDQGVLWCFVQNNNSFGNAGECWRVTLPASLVLCFVLSLFYCVMFVLSLFYYVMLFYVCFMTTCFFCLETLSVNFCFMFVLCRHVVLFRHVSLHRSAYIGWPDEICCLNGIWPTNLPFSHLISRLKILVSLFLLSCRLLHLNKNTRSCRVVGDVQLERMTLQDWDHERKD